MKIKATNNKDGTITVDVDSFRSVVSYATMLTCLIELGIDKTEIWTKATIMYQETVDAHEGLSTSKFNN